MAQKKKNNNSEWRPWSKHVLKELDRLSRGHNEITHQLTDIKTDLASLKVKASAWGALGGMLPVLAVKQNAPSVITKPFQSSVTIPWGAVWMTFMRDDISEKARNRVLGTEGVDF